MSDRLERYREMRDFRHTPEPRGRFSEKKPIKEELHYYIQRHDARRLHYDFRLELDGTLKSWAVPKGPSLDPSVKRLAVQVEDHPLEYGEFEGTIPEKHYGAGDVLLWDKGVWIAEDDDPAAALRKGRLHFRLEGEKLRGSWILTRTRKEEKKPQWLLIKRHDDEARPGADEVVLEKPESVKEIPKPKRQAKKSEVPEFIAPQLATLVTEPPRAGEWLYEVKHDGYRMLATFSGKSVRLYTRTGLDWTARLPHLAKALEKLDLDDSLLDGEIVVPGPNGRSSFQALQNAFEHGAGAKIVYYVFDAPFLEGQDLRRLPLKERKARLKKIFPDANAGQGQVRFSEDLGGDAKEVLEHACRLGLEGLIGKDAGAVYVSGRSRSWIKLKCRQRQDFVIGGYTPPRGSRSGFGALFVGYYDKARKLRYAGKVGTGFDEEGLRSLTQRFARLKRDDAPFADPPREKGATWLQPKLVAEVAFAERTDEGILRQAAFMGLRQDLPAKSVHEEKPVPASSLSSKNDVSNKKKSKGKKGKKKAGNEVQGVIITHPDRVVWPSAGVTKLELARYCEEVGDWLLPQVKDRPLSLVRCPDGAEGKCFFQRHLLRGASPGHLQVFKRENSEKEAYIYVSSLEGVLRSVQNGAVEFHTWGATVPDVKHPDRFTLDLDPDPDLPWKRLVEGARLVKTLLDELKLKSFLKTTGGKGLHIVVPVKPALEWDEVKEFTRLIAVMLTRARPDLFIDKMAKERRTGKIFVDYLRNSQTASAVAAYSPRARPGATVSTPLSWAELDKTDLRAKFTVRSVPQRLARLRSDPWRDYPKTRQSITGKMLAAVGKTAGKK
jgi:bifunctional non-homologous end joining protein LigD